MKTNVVMKSQDRNLFGNLIKQETKTSFLNLSDLQEAYTRIRINEGWNDKKVQELLSYTDNRERIYYLLLKRGYINSSLNEFMQNIEREGTVHYLKKIKAYKTTGARHTKTTWCDPYIWSLVAMELNPKLYAEVVTWLTDQLIINRIEAGNFYRDLSRAITRFTDTNYKELAQALNYIIWNRHEPGIRNTGTQKELKELEELEKQMAFAINMGYIKTQEQLLEDLRKIWKQKWSNSIIKI